MDFPAVSDQEINALSPDGRRKRYVVGFYVEVETNAYQEVEAPTVALAATRWPQRMTHDPLHVQGELNGDLFGADVIYASPLMVKKAGKS